MQCETSETKETVRLTRPRKVKPPNLSVFCYRATDDRIAFIKYYSKLCTKLEKKESGLLVSMNDVVAFAIDLLREKHESEKLQE